MPNNTAEAEDKELSATTGSKLIAKANKRKPSKRRKARKSKNVKTVSAQAQPWTFPKVTLEKAIELAQTLEEKNAGNPIRAEHLAPMLGFRKPNDWRFADILRAANQYGIVEGTGLTSTVSLTDIGADIVAPSSPTQRQAALVKAFANVELFRRVSEFYAGKPIPEDEYFGNTLTRDFGVPRERVPTFISVFQSNLEYLKAFTADSTGRPVVSTIGAESKVAEVPSVLPSVVPAEGERGEGVREFLDTCFILMPFGSWFDRYFKEIYVPATKEAGFEPLRADGLFSAGAVMEQVWAQIRKAKVLLADLTGKNPNVFYELGLAHAARKPVVFVAGDIEDVPFDVRHLRVVVFDIREPGWSDRLRRDITTYLKNTRSEPEKSIPQPYREFPLDEPEGPSTNQALPAKKTRR
jgi:hypothetical protein